MAATAITPVTRYWAVGTTKWLWVATIANYTVAVTRAEINAGTDLSGEIADLSGWTVTSNQIDTPDVNSRFRSKIPGPIEAEDSSLTIYADPSGSDVRSLLPRDATGYILRMDGGDIAGRKMSVFPVKVASQNKLMGTDEEAARIEVSFTITRQPAEDLTIPA
jgi:hypothetical protein